MTVERPSRLLFTVEDVFSIKSRGLVLVPGITPQPGERFRVGDPISLHRPDGSRMVVEIGAFDLFASASDPPEFPVLLLGLSRDDVPIGTQVWSVG